eukprot:697624_1
MTGSCSLWDTLVIARYRAASIVIHNTLFVFSGYIDGSTSTNTYEYKLLPTAQPTVNPTTTPTDIPTSGPTGIPTSSPNTARTSTPTGAPTAVPSIAPSAWEDCIDETIQLDTGYIQLFVNINAVSRTMQIQLTAPKDIWFGIGFGSDAMSNTVAITVSSLGGTMAVRTRRLRHHLQGDIVSDALDDVQTTVFRANRMVNILQSWTMDELFDFSDFLVGNQCELPIIWAVGSNSVLGDHGSNRGSITLWSCMCSEDPTESPSQMPTKMPTEMPTVTDLVSTDLMPTDSIDILSSGANYVQLGFVTMVMVMCCTLFSF